MQLYNDSLLICLKVPQSFNVISTTSVVLIQHSPLLVQVTSTNSLKSYHSKLKRTTSPHYSLIGVYRVVFNKSFQVKIMFLVNLGLLEYLGSYYQLDYSGTFFLSHFIRCLLQGCHAGCTDSEYIAFEFRTKKISVVALDDGILNEFHKFLYPI